MNKRFALKILLAFTVILPIGTLGQTYPSHPIRIIVPFPTGGASDVVARTVAQEISKTLGQQVIVENKPGAGTVIGVDAAAKSPPDGYTLALIATSFTVNHTLVAKLPYDSLKDFRPISFLSRAPQVIAGKSSLPPRSLQEP